MWPPSSTSVKLGLKGTLHIQLSWWTGGWFSSPYSAELMKRGKGWEAPPIIDINLKIDSAMANRIPHPPPFSLSSERFRVLHCNLSSYTRFVLQTICPTHYSSHIRVCPAHGLSRIRLVPNKACAAYGLSHTQFVTHCFCPAHGWYHSH
jgi:hypothetical protein